LSVPTATNAKHLPRSRSGQGTIDMESIRPENTDPIPLRAAPTQFGTIMIRFVGLLIVAIAILAFVYSR
jgi:hypothetical protein